MSKSRVAFLRSKSKGVFLFMSKTITEKIEETKLQIVQYKNREKQLMQCEKQEERKLRTRRLIERGAIIESIFSETVSLTNEQFKTFLVQTINNDSARKVLENLIAISKETQKVSGEIEET